MKKWLVIPALAGVLVIGGVAMAGNTGHSLAATPEGLLSIAEAEAIAVNSVGGSVTDIELDRDKSGDIYEVEVESDGIEYDLDIDAKTGEIVRTEKDDDDETDDKVIDVDGKFMTKEAAIEIAMKQAKGTVTSIELEKEDGNAIYEIEIKDGTDEYEFDIDAISGEVLKFEKDREDD